MCLLCHLTNFASNVAQIQKDAAVVALSKVYFKAQAALINKVRTCRNAGEGAALVALVAAIYTWFWRELCALCLLAILASAFSARAFVHVNTGIGHVANKRGKLYGIVQATFCFVRINFARRGIFINH